MQFKIRHECIPLGLPEPMRIVALSDLHIGSWLRADDVEDVIKAANDASPDFIALLGDYVMASPEHAYEAARALGNLQAPLGVYAVLGNHDYWAGREIMKEMLEREGIQVLINERRRIVKGDAQLLLVGFDDIWWGIPAWRIALDGSESGVPVVVMVHNPDAALDERAQRVNLILAGHTHGGQVNPFGRFVIPSRFGRQHPAGLTRHGNVWVFITSGVGMVTLPIRFRCPPEVAVLELM